MGILHRDIKPSNIFLARSTPSDISLARTAEPVTVKLIDFGIAKLAEEPTVDLAATGEGVALGTPLFSSPEQLAGQGALDHRSDLWSLGVVIYLALTGNHPFALPDSVTAGSAMKLAFAIATQDPHPASTFPGLDDRADAFFARALAKDREQRFASAAEMSEAFLALTDGAPARASLLELLDEAAAAKVELHDRPSSEASFGSPPPGLPFSAPPHAYIPDLPP